MRFFGEIISLIKFHNSLNVYKFTTSQFLEWSFAIKAKLGVHLQLGKQSSCSLFPASVFLFDMRAEFGTGPKSPFPPAVLTFGASSEEFSGTLLWFRGLSQQLLSDVSY